METRFELPEDDRRWFDQGGECRPTGRRPVLRPALEALSTLRLSWDAGWGLVALITFLASDWIQSDSERTFKAAFIFSVFCGLLASSSPRCRAGTAAGVLCLWSALAILWDGIEFYLFGVSLGAAYGFLIIQNLLKACDRLE